MKADTESMLNERAMQKPYEIIIVGGGLTGSLMALFLSSYRPEVRFLLIEASESCGSTGLETAIWDEIPEKLQPVVDGAIVKEWNHCFIAYPNGSQRVDRRIVMIDPTQLHLEVLRRLSEDELRLNSEIIEIAGDTVKHGHGADKAKTIVDARENETLHSLNVLIKTHNADFGKEHHLEVPVLADFSLTDDGWLLRQYFPVDPTKMLVRHIGPANSAKDVTEDQGNLSRKKFVSSSSEAELGDNRLDMPELSIIPSRLQLATKLAAALMNSTWLDMKTIAGLMTEIQTETAMENRRFLNWVPDFTEK